MNESGITVAFHGGDSGYGRYFADWGEGGDVESFKGSAWKGVVAGNRAPFDAMAALVCHGLFHRFPRIRVCSIEMGSNWVPWLIQSFKRAYGISPKDFHGDPVETFRRHVWISPFHEDDVKLLKELLGADRLLMGSDWPHAEGLRDPTDYVRELVGLHARREQKLVMHDNALGLSQADGPRSQAAAPPRVSARSAGSTSRTKRASQARACSRSAPTERPRSSAARGRARRSSREPRDACAGGPNTAKRSAKPASSSAACWLPVRAWRFMS